MFSVVVAAVKLVESVDTRTAVDFRGVLKRTLVDVRRRRATCALDVGHEFNVHLAVQQRVRCLRDGLRDGCRSVAPARFRVLPICPLRTETLSSVAQWI